MSTACFHKSRNLTLKQSPFNHGRRQPMRSQPFQVNPLPLPPDIHRNEVFPAGITPRSMLHAQECLYIRKKGSKRAWSPSSASWLVDSYSIWHWRWRQHLPSKIWCPFVSLHRIAIPKNCKWKCGSMTRYDDALKLIVTVQFRWFS